MGKFFLQLIMARKSVAVEDIIPMDRGKMFTDLCHVKRSLKKALEISDEDGTKRWINTSIQEIRGE